MGGTVAAGLLAVLIFCIGKPVRDRRGTATGSSARQSQRLVVVVVVVVASAVILTMILIAAPRTTDRGQFMQTTSLPPRDDNTIEASVTIKRPVKEIFSFIVILRICRASWGTLWPLSRSVRQLLDGQYKAPWAFE